MIQVNLVESALAKNIGLNAIDEIVRQNFHVLYGGGVLLVQFRNT